jgi:molecular chaperone DnaJ
MYDRFGHQGVQSAAGAGGFDPSQFSDFSDILGDFFGFSDLFGGAGRKRNRPQRGEDVGYNLEISLEDAWRGMQAEIQVPRHETCSDCRGSGADANDGLTTCPVCRGRGEIVSQQAFLSIRRTCHQCGGRGQLVRKACQKCKGEGSIRIERKLKLNIPPGVDTGTRLRLSGEGQPGHLGGPAGDLYVIVGVKEHPIFDREGNDLHCTVPVNIAQAALGTEVDILTFEGLQQVKIPEGTQAGSEVRVRGEGMPVLNGHGKGDLVVHVDVRVPGKLTREQRKLFEQLRDVLPTENEPREKGIFDRVKDYFV